MCCCIEGLLKQIFAHICKSQIISLLHLEFRMNSLGVNSLNADEVYARYNKPKNLVTQLKLYDYKNRPNPIINNYDYYCES